MKFNDSFSESIDKGMITEGLGKWILKMASIVINKNKQGLSNIERDIIHSDIVYKSILLINNLIDDSNYCEPNPYNMVYTVMRNMYFDEIRRRFKKSNDGYTIRKRDEYGCSLRMSKSIKFPQYARIINDSEL